MTNNVFVNRDGLEIPYSDCLLDTKSSYQRIRILQTYKLGKIIVLDDIMFQAEQGDELTEMAVHVPLNTGIPKRNILGIGLGDGFALKELVKHDYLKSIDIVEIDPIVLNSCRKIFPFNGNVWSDSRIKFYTEDGFKFIASAKHKSYDVIISTPANTYTSAGEPNIAFPLFKEEFFKEVYNSLSDDGIFVTDGSTSHYSDKEPNWVNINEDLKEVFPTVLPYWFASKRMPGGSFVLILASKNYHPVRNYQKNLEKLECNYYNECIHKSSFCLPEFLRNKL